MAKVKLKTYALAKAIVYVHAQALVKVLAHAGADWYKKKQVNVLPRLTYH